MAQELQIRGRDAALQCDRAMDQLSIDAEVKGEIRTAFLVAFEIGEPMFFFKEKKKARIMEELLAIELALFSAACGEKLRTLKDSGEISEDDFDAARRVLEERLEARAALYGSLPGFLAAAAKAERIGADPAKAVLDEARNQVLRAKLGASVPMGGLFAIFADGAQKKAEHFAQGSAAGLFRD